MTQYTREFFRQFTNPAFNIFDNKELAEILYLKEQDFTILVNYLKAMVSDKTSEFKADFLKFYNFNDRNIIDDIQKSFFSQIYIHDSHVLKLVSRILDQGLGQTHRIARLLVETHALSMDRLNLLTFHFASYKTRLLSDALAADNLMSFLERASHVEDKSREYAEMYTNNQVKNLNYFLRSEMYEKTAFILQHNGLNSIPFFDYQYMSCDTGKIEHEIIHITYDESFPLFIHYTRNNTDEVILPYTCAELMNHTAEGQFEDVSMLILYKVYEAMKMLTEV